MDIPTLPPYKYFGSYELTKMKGALSGNEVSSGSVFEDSSSMNLYFYDPNCSTTLGKYYYMYDTLKHISFSPISDPCQNRINFLMSGIFKVKDIFNNSVAACPETPVKFTAVGGNSLKWYFGDGGSDTLNKNVAYHAYSIAGNYDAYAIVKNSCGRKDTIHTPVVISVYSVPSAQINVNNGGSTNVVGLPVQFQTSTWYGDTTGYKSLWKFGDGDTSNLSAPSHVYLKPGDYNVMLIVSNGCGADTSNMEIHINGKFTPSCGAEFAYLSSGATVEFYNLTDVAGTNLLWNFGDSTVSSNRNPVHSYSNMGDYLVCLNAINSGDTTCTSCQQIFVGNMQQCVANFYYTYNGSDVQFTSASEMSGLYAWDFGDGAKVTTQSSNVSHSYTNPGWYQVTLTATTLLNCTSTSSQWIQIKATCPQPDLILNIGSDSVSIVNNTPNKDNLIWFWYYGDGTTSSAVDPGSHVFKQGGVYYMYVTMFDPITGCKLKLDTTVLIGSVGCYAYFTSDTTNGGSTVDFYNKSSHAASYFWTFGDGTVSNIQNPPAKTYNKAGVYNVCLDYNR